MKIAFISYEKADDLSAWSGTISFMAKYLEKDNELIRIDNLSRFYDYCFKLTDFVAKFFGKSSDFKRNRSFLKSANKRVQKKLDNENFDIIFAPGVSYITYIKTDKPIVCWADATFQSLIDTYPQYSNLTKSQIKNGNELEKLAFKNLTKIIFSTS